MRGKQSKNGFTLIEMVLVLLLVGLLAALVIPPSLTFFQTTRLNSASWQLLAVLRQAQTSALNQKNDGAYGVYLDNNNYTFFKGTSYSSRDPSYDETYSWPRGIEAEGPTEIVFSKLSGFPQAAGEITLTNGFRATIIQINSEGLISCNLNVSITTP